MTDQQKPSAEAGATAEAGKQYTPEETQAEIKRLRDENKRRRLEADAALAELTARKKADEEREQAWLKEQGDFKTLYEKQQAEYDRVKAEAASASAYQTAFKANLDARIAAIPEGMRSLVPDGLDAIKLDEWLSRNAALLANRRAPNLDAGAGAGIGGGTPAPTPTATDVAMADNFRIPVSEYMKYKAESEALRGSATTDKDLKKMG